VNLRSIFGRRGLSKTPPEPLSLDPALRRQIRTSFDEASANEEHFPSTIDPRIQHVQVILKHFGDLTEKKVLDAGCGKGRFARVLLERYPGARVTGLDISEAMLRGVSHGIGRIAGALTELPFAPSTFDFVYATESLEHAVDTSTAVEELCRVLKPGGRLVIIDKNAEHWGKLETPVWERWFDRREIERMLERHCSSVHSDFISYWEDVAPDGMFIVWTALK
jgi:malonyl-CoA O-methyltransferase